MPQTTANTKTDCMLRLEFGRKVFRGERADRLRDLKVGDVVELETFVDDYVDVHADGRLVARGRPIVIDGKLGVRVQEALGGQVASPRASG